jgi:Family of unknown function (DUF6152)
MKSVFKLSFVALAIALATLAIQPALAHHSSAGFSEESRVVSGTVKEFQFRNPHSWIQVNVTDASGKVTEWSVEWGSPNQLGREGIRPSTFPAGAQVTIKLRPEMTGAPIGIFVGAKMSDGKTVGKWSEN